jgi:uncharacterized protein YaiL (DUF2058 family)
MAKSIRDQLMLAGLTTKHKALKANKANKAKNKQSKKGKKEESSTKLQQNNLAIQEQVEKDKELNLIIEKKRKQKALDAQVNQLIKNNKLPRIHGNSYMRFVDNHKIKKILVVADMLTKLHDGLLSIVKYQDNYEVIPKDIAERINDLIPDIVFNLAENKDQKNSTEEDWYKDHHIPDDLMW